MWSWPLDGPGAWTIVPIEGRAPLGTSGMQSAYDPAGDRVIVLPPASELDSVPVLELAGSAPRWVRLAVAGGPPPDRSGAALVVDQARGRLLVEGGVYPSYDGSHLRDLWSLSLSGAPPWTDPAPARLRPLVRDAPGPRARSHARSATRHRRHRPVVHGPRRPEHALLRSARGTRGLDRPRPGQPVPDPRPGGGGLRQRGASRAVLERHAVGDHLDVRHARRARGRDRVRRWERRPRPLARAARGALCRCDRPHPGRRSVVDAGRERRGAARRLARCHRRPAHGRREPDPVSGGDRARRHAPRDRNGGDRS